MKKYFLSLLFTISSIVITAQTPTLNYSNGSLTGTSTRTFTVASAILNETPSVTNFSSSVYVKSVVSNLINFRNTGGGSIGITQPGMLYPNGYQNYRFASGNGRVYSLDYGGLVDAYQTAPQGSRPSFPSMGTPYSVATIAAGDLVSDPSTHRIYLVTSASTPTVVVGNPSLAQSGDQPGGVNAAVLMSSPMSILPIPGLRNQVWVADKGNNKIKILNVETQTTTDQVVNGVTLNAPVGLALDPTGTILYVTDANRLIKIELTNNNTASVIAGAATAGDIDGVVGTSRLNNPMGIAVDRDGNVFIADKLNHKIKIYVPSAGELVTIAGNGTAGDVLGQDQTAQFNQPVAILYDYGANTLQVSDYGNNKIKTLTFTTAYTIAPAVPAGLSFNKFTGIISGTPTNYTPLRNYTITLDNGAGTAQIVLPIQVLDIPPTNLNYSSSANIFTVGTTITNLLPSNTGGVIASYSVYPSLPAGLSMSATTGIISGTPTEGTVQTDYVITGTNTGGTITSTVSIYVQGPPYNMGYTRSEAVFAVGSPVVLLALPKSFPAPSGFTLNINSPALPAGLSLNSVTGEITGTPTTVTSARAILVDVTNAFGTSTGQIVVEVMAAPSLSYVNPSPYLATNLISPLTPTLGGGPVTISTGGMSNTGIPIGDNMGNIRAYPIYIFADGIRYLATPGNSLGKTITTFSGGSSGSLQFPAQVDFLVMDAQRLFYIVDNAAKQIVKSTTGGTKIATIGLHSTASSYTGFANGRSHLAQFGTMGQVSTDATGATIYVPDVSNLRIRKIDAINNVVTTLAGDGTVGTSNGVGMYATFSNPLAVALSTDGNLYILDRQSNRDVIRKLNLTTLEVSDFKVLPQLAASTTMVVDRIGDLYVTHANNTLAKIDRAANYTIVTGPGQNGTQQAFGELSITPEGVVSIGATTSLAYGFHYTPSESFSIRPKNNGSAMFDGLNFNTNTAQITGTPTGNDITPNDYIRIFTVTASNRAGIFESDVILTVVKPPAGVSYTQPSPIQVGTNASFTPNGSFGVPLGIFTVSPTLPAGLSIHPNTGVISGNALALTPSGTYTVTCTNQYGVATGLIILEVADAPRIAYNGPQVYLKNTAITALLPTNTGGSVLFPAETRLSTIAGATSSTRGFLINGNDADAIDIQKTSNGDIYILYTIFNPSTYTFDAGQIRKLDAITNAETIVGDLSFGPYRFAPISANDIYIATGYGDNKIYHWNGTSISQVMDEPKPDPLFMTDQNNYVINRMRIFNNKLHVLAKGDNFNGVYVYSINTQTHALMPSNDYTFQESSLSYWDGTYDQNWNYNMIAIPRFNNQLAVNFYSPFASGQYEFRNGVQFKDFHILSSGEVVFLDGNNQFLVYSFGQNGGLLPLRTVPSGLMQINSSALDENDHLKITGQLYSNNGFSGGAYYTVDGLFSLDISNSNNNPLSILTTEDPNPNASQTLEGLQDGVLPNTITISKPNNILVDAFGAIIFTEKKSGWPATNDRLRKFAERVAYRITPTLPFGLTINAQTGAISGTATVVSPATNYVITAYNNVGSRSTVLNITVGELPAFTYSNIIATSGSVISANTPNSTVLATSYAISPNITAYGLNFNTATGEISGTPTYTLSSSIFTVTGTNRYGSSTANLTLAITGGSSLPAGTAPTGLSYSSSSFTVSSGTATNTVIAAIPTITSSTNNIIYSISPGLPNGLTFNTSTGQITVSGSPITASLLTNYTITATTAYGSTSTSFSLQVGAVPSALSYPNAAYSFWKGDAISNITPTVTHGSGATTFSAVGLPTGLTIDPISGTIYGIPSTAQAAGTATMTASNTYGSTTYTISFAIIAPPTILYNTSNTYTTSQSGISLTPTVTGGLNNTIALNVSNSAFNTATGLNINTSSGRITGTAKSTALSTTTYTATISSTVNGVSKTATNNFNITIGAAPSSLSYTSPQVIALNNRIPNLTPSITAGVGVTYTATGLPAGLTIDPNTGIIYGTPTVNQSATNATITATNAYGSTQATISFSVGEAPSNLVFNPAINYLLVNALSVNIPSTVNPGSGGVTYSISPSLPTGFSLDPNTGIISGATALITNANYVVTASNTYGATSTIFQLASNNGPNFSYVRNHVYSAGATIPALIPTIYYGAGSTLFSVTPNLPAGLTLDPLTGDVSGTPTAGLAVPLDSYSVTGTNLFGTSNARLDIEVQGPPTNLNYGANIIQPINVPLSNVITPSVVASPAVSTYSVSPALPAGLSFDPTTGVISGTPTVAQQAVVYTFSADNWIAPSATYTMTITVSASPIISYSTPQSYVVGNAIIQLMPTVQNAVSLWSISPALPTGLNFNTNTGAITGTPTSASSGTFTISATNSFGTGTASVQIIVNAPPASLSYTLSNQNFTTGIAIPNSTPSINAGTGSVTYTVSPNLPVGLTINPNSGVISGTPTVAIANASYTVTATSAYGSTSAVINFATGIAPAALSYTASNIFTAGTSITALSPIVTVGSGTLTYNVSPNLPAGLTLNPSTGVISGTPLSGSPAATFTVTATSVFGSTSASFQVAVQGPPTNLLYPSNSLSFLINTPVTSVVPSIVAFPAPVYSVAPNLPAGLVLNPNTGAITGTPILGQPATNYTITANNGIMPSTTIVISIAVPAAPIINYASSYVFTKDQVITLIQPTVVNRVDSWSITPSLPSGLIFDNTNGQITGTPTTIIVAGNYTVTASNNYGAATASFVLDVQGPPAMTLNNNNNTIVGLQPIQIAAPVLNSNPAPIFTISPNLPAGLVLNSSTGAITGTPTNYSTAITYSIRATNSIGTTTIPVVLAILPPVAAINSASNKLCGKTPLQLSNATSNGVWSSLQPLIATVSNSGLVSGIGPVDAPVIIAYTITVQGVSNTAYDTLDYVAAPALPIRLPTVDLIKSEPTVLQARPIAVQYNWTPSIWLSNTSIMNPTVIANQEVEFKIEMIATNGCKTIDTLTARMFDRADVFLPNMFTPNGDGINDLFKINPVGIQTLNYFRVFNQWGKMIFQTNRLAEGWDGYYDNQLQPLDSYNWLLEAIDTKGKLIQKAGTVTLIR